MGDYITTSSEGFGLRKGNAAAIVYFNNWISQNKAWLAQRHSYWFKTQDWATLVP